MLAQGQTFAARYRVGECLAHGDRGVVYEAEHAATGERVALKVLWPHLFGSTAAAKGFPVEARAAARLGGEHIVRILDAGFDESLGAAFVAMELLRGQTLEALVRRGGPLAPAEVLWALAQVAEALVRAHGYVDCEGRPAPVVHCDLKPEKLFLARRDGADPVVKVLDFGLAAALGGRPAPGRGPHDGPLFLASEQLEGGPLTPRADLWAFGLIAFYLLTGRSYWRGASAPDAGEAPLVDEVVRSPLETPSRRARDFGVATPWSPAFDGWFLSCVAREPARRFSCARAALEGLSGALGVEIGRAPAPLGPAPEHPASELFTPSATSSPRAGGRAKPRSSPLEAPPPDDRLTQALALTSDLDAPSRNVPRSKRSRAKLRAMRGAWALAGFVVGGAVTAVALHGGPEVEHEALTLLGVPGEPALEPAPAPAAAPTSRGRPDALAAPLPTLLLPPPAPLPNLLPPAAPLRSDETLPLASAEPAPRAAPAPAASSSGAAPPAPAASPLTPAAGPAPSSGRRVEE